MRIWCDGAGYNGRYSRYCVYIENKKKEIFATKTKLTCNEMEYRAVIKASEIARPGDTILTDSQLVVNQLTKNWGINASHLISLHKRAKAILKEKELRLVWIPRKENRAGQVMHNLTKKQKRKKFK